MRKIKFRGIDAVTKKYIYGYYCPFMCDETMPMIYIAQGFCKVEGDSVSQFIGFDKNGKEIYENDKVIRIAGEDYEAEKTFPMAATFEDFAAIRDGEIVKVS